MTESKGPLSVVKFMGCQTAAVRWWGGGPSPGQAWGVALSVLLRLGADKAPATLRSGIVRPHLRKTCVQPSLTELDRDAPGQRRAWPDRAVFVLETLPSQTQRPRLCSRAAPWGEGLGSCRLGTCLCDPRAGGRKASSARVGAGAGVMVYFGLQNCPTS